MLITGFQSQGTPGRAMVDGARHIRLWGETVAVSAQVHTIGGFSAHADQDDLTTWYSQFSHRPPVVLVHGEQEAITALADHLGGELSARVRIAKPEETLDMHKLNSIGHVG